MFSRQQQAGPSGRSPIREAGGWRRCSASFASWAALWRWMRWPAATRRFWPCLQPARRESAVPGGEEKQAARRRGPGQVAYGAAAWVRGRVCGARAQRPQTQATRKTYGFGIGDGHPLRPGGMPPQCRVDGLSQLRRRLLRGGRENVELKRKGAMASAASGGPRGKRGRRMPCPLLSPPRTSWHWA